MRGGGGVFLDQVCRLWRSREEGVDMVMGEVCW